MNTKKFLGRLVTASLVLALMAIAAPAFAQFGGVSGKVVDEKGNPVADADILVSNPSNVGTTKPTRRAAMQPSGSLRRIIRSRRRRAI